MTSLEGLFRELFLHARQARQRTFWASLAMYLFLSCGYLRTYAKALRGASVPFLPGVPSGKAALSNALSVLPIGLFYLLLPVAAAWALSVLLGLIMLNFLIPFAWALLVIFGWILMAVALIVIEDDPERFFLGLNPEKVVMEAWKIKSHLFFPAIFCYGVAALLGPWFYGFSFFIAIAVLTAYANVSLEK